MRGECLAGALTPVIITPVIRVITPRQASTGAPYCAANALHTGIDLGSCQTAPMPSGGGNPFSSAWHGLVAAYHGTLHYYDVANNATNTALDHVFVQLEVCLIGCVSATAQGSHLFVSASFPTFTTIGRKPSAFAGLNLGVNSATSEQAIQSNRQFGGGIVAPEGVGGGGGLMGYEGRNGLGPMHQYGYEAYSRHLVEVQPNNG